jgi:hypothetical protein
VHDLVQLQDLLEATIALVYQQHRHRGIGMSPEQRLAGKLSQRRVAAAELSRVDRMTGLDPSQRACHFSRTTRRPRI